MFQLGLVLCKVHGKPADCILRSKHWLELHLGCDQMVAGNLKDLLTPQQHSECVPLWVLEDLHVTLGVEVAEEHQVDLLVKLKVDVGVVSGDALELSNELVDGRDEEILVQIPVMEEALASAGFTVWPMVTHEADDALGAAAVVVVDDAMDPRQRTRTIYT